MKSLIVVMASLLQIVGFIFIIMNSAGIKTPATTIIIGIGGIATILKWPVMEMADAPCMFFTRLGAAAGLGIAILAFFVK